MEPSPDDLLSPAEARAILNVDYLTLWRWTEEFDPPKIRSVRVGDHGWHKYRRRDVEALRDPEKRPWETLPWWMHPIGPERDAAKVRQNGNPYYKPLDVLYPEES